ncbi:GNAT family N-acetyltransferase [Loktanella sp. D2R18]|uniref:GNAT family N-acetyltransferase n=1 Tax=Rhodobacterales TaxID=204455 RepID=UPI000DE82139|nr:MULTISPECIES: GNAT family N-acetyltransferase [Rhodobacterales]MDO6590252.1 GNAT family N-acetyltransferase [Yoonia sp. 1_MG-2023]RBW42937.1 GNAT family N-acetyltransferase [Loktanella sp. D2R18]
MITLRAATASDWDAIWPLLRDVFREGMTYAVDPKITKEAARSYWMGAAAVYVAATEDGVVGTYYIKTNQPGGGAHICNCGYIVGTAARGQGLARKMCAHSQDAALDMGYTAMQFNFVLDSNTYALKLWRDMGFATLGTIPDAFAHPQAGMVDAHIMYKSLC